MISARKAKQLDATTMLTYSHANTPLGQSERAHYLSYFIKEKSSTPTGLVWDTNMAAVSLFWDTNMAAVTSYENTLYVYYCIERRYGFYLCSVILGQLESFRNYKLKGLQYYFPENFRCNLLVTYYKSENFSGLSPSHLCIQNFYVSFFSEKLPNLGSEM